MSNEPVGALRGGKPEEWWDGFDAGREHAMAVARMLASPTVGAVGAVIPPVGARVAASREEETAVSPLLDNHVFLAARPEPLREETGELERRLTGVENLAATAVLQRDRAIERAERAEEERDRLRTACDYLRSVVEQLHRDSHDAVGALAEARQSTPVSSEREGE